jgi:threonine/homoserine/homoserine lactone efflux protein
MIGAFLQSLLIGYSGALMPGSLLTYTIDKSIKKGATSGLLISIGHSIMELFLVLLMLFGLAKYLSTDLAKTIIGIIGGLILISLGISMIRDIIANKVNIDLEGKADNRTGNMIVGGAVISASNPYFIFWWATVGLGLIMSGYSSFGVLGVIVVYIGHILSDITWYCFISILISKTRVLFNLKIYKVLIVFLGLCLIGFGLRFLIESLVHIQ